MATSVTVEPREILAKVASGELSPEEAARLLDHRPTTDAGPAGEIAGVTIEAELGSISVVGDPSVREVVVDGPHTAQRRGDRFVVSSELPGAAGFQFGGRGSHGSLGRRAHRVEVRANPDLELDAEISAGTLQISGMRGPITARTEVGNLRLEDFVGPIDLSVAAGNVTASGRLSRGQSRIRCELGRVRVDLDPVSNVTITARAELGRITLPDGRPTNVVDGHRAVVLGEGTATLALEASAGRIDVRTQR